MFFVYKKMILHLERKFLSPSETFIANQINFTSQFETGVFTVQYTPQLYTRAKVFYPDYKLTSLELKLLSSRSKRFFRQTFSTQPVQVIHAHYLTDASFFSPFTKHCAGPKICSCYGYDVNEYPNRYGYLMRLYYKSVFKQYNLFLAMSDYMKKELIGLGCPAEKILVHYHGIDTGMFDVKHVEKPGKVLRLLTIARLSPTKGHITVLKALHAFRQQFPGTPFRYTIVGDGELKEQLTTTVSHLELGDVVSFYPFCKHGEQFNNYLGDADIFLLPCRKAKGATEGIPGAVVEAMAGGLPVISTYHGGIPAVIEDGKTGFLVEENDEQAIANLLFRLYGDNDLRRRIGNNARVFAQAALDVKQRTLALEKIYGDLLNGSNR